jgi:hypothetical protein
VDIYVLVQDLSKSIADVIQDFPIHYQEINFIEEIPLAIESSFLQRLELVLTEGVVFNSEYAICENIISPIPDSFRIKSRGF